MRRAKKQNIRARCERERLIKTVLHQNNIFFFNSQIAWAVRSLIKAFSKNFLLKYRNIHAITHVMEWFFGVMRDDEAAWSHQITAWRYSVRNSTIYYKYLYKNDKIKNFHNYSNFDIRNIILLLGINLDRFVLFFSIPIPLGRFRFQDDSYFDSLYKCILVFLNVLIRNLWKIT